MEPLVQETIQNAQLSFEHFRQEVLKDYRMACISREASLLGRKEVLTGKAKFGIFGDGKEVPQLAMAKFFRPGDFYSGYYRDQTFAFATGATNVQEFFAQLYADPDPNNEPNSSGRQMNSHFATQFVDETGKTIDLINRKNLSASLAPTAAQMPKAVGLALASTVFRNLNQPESFQHLTNNGSEVCFVTIGDASTSEGPFWESVNAAAVQQIPMAIFVWDDGYGISVPKKFQTTKESISEALKGFQKKEGDANGLDIYRLKAWDYAGMCEVLETAIEKIRITHTPALFHVEEVTQPQGHSTSGSHERYKTPERLQWERDWDCIKKMKEWLTENALATEEELNQIEVEAKEQVRKEKQQAWENFLEPITRQVSRVVSLLGALSPIANAEYIIPGYIHELNTNREPSRRDVMRVLYKGISVAQPGSAKSSAQQYYQELTAENNIAFHSCQQVDHFAGSALSVAEVKATYEDTPQVMNGYEILNRYFDQLFTRRNDVLAFGEDLGFIGDVNQGFAGLQAKHGAHRIFDTGIRELTIMGQGIGLALRGLRPIAEIQYLDYLLYGLQPLSDDLATLHYRSRGRQSAPMIIRTRGHRLEGIWHSGSPLGMIINSLRGIHICVPRNMVQAAGMYNTLLQSNEPGLVIECLNGYRLKENLPTNLSEFTVPLGIPDVIRNGDDVTIVSYGSTLRIIEDAAQHLEILGISCEIIDVQTLLPFDRNHIILESLKKTSRIIFIDEDVPGGAAAFMFNKVMEEQGGYRYLDVAPRTLTATDHRPAYGSDGDYFSKPNAEDIIRVISEMMNE